MGLSMRINSGILPNYAETSDVYLSTYVIRICPTGCCGLSLDILISNLTLELCKRLILEKC